MPEETLSYDQQRELNRLSLMALRANGHQPVVFDSIEIKWRNVHRDELRIEHRGSMVFSVHEWYGMHLNPYAARTALWALLMLRRTTVLERLADV